MLVYGAWLFYFITSFLYGAFTLWLLTGLYRNRKQPRTDSPLTVSIIIPARNEAAGLDRCLSALRRQTYPAHLYEIIVVDDDSSDRTAAIAQSHGVRYFLLGEIPEAWSPKKAALQLGIRNSRAEIILTTDADCIAPTGWIETMASYFVPEVGVVISWVDIEENGSRLARLEALDAWALQIVGAAAIGHQRPFLANGANWGYRRQHFIRAGGFDGIAEPASGDDDLLLQKMGGYGCRIVFADAPECRVATQACNSLSAFFMQRLRWASKTNRYPFSVIALEFFIFVYHGSLLILTVLVFFKPVWITFLLIKIICDALVFLASGLSKRHKRLWRDFLLAQWWQVLYMLVVGLIAWRGRFVWKGRRYVHGRLEREKRI